MNTVDAPWQAAPRIRQWQSRTLWVLMVAQMLGGLAVGAGSAMGSLVVYEISHSEAQAGLVRVVGALGIAILAGPLAAFAVRRGRRTAMVTGWGIATLGGLILLSSLAVKSMPLLVVGTFLFSAGNTANLQMRFAATDMEVPHRSGRTLSLVVWAATVGAVLSPSMAPVFVPWARAWGLPPIAGVYLISVVGLVVVTVLLLILLRPDPMRVAQEHGQAPRSGRKGGSLALLPRLWTMPGVPLAVVGSGCNRAVMVAVMALTPVHMAHVGHSLPTVGLVLSVHIVGMFAFSPLVGWLADRFGSVRLILVGMGINLAALAACVMAGESLSGLFVGLFLLGLGWSFADIACATLLVTSVDDDVRAPAQGVLDSSSNLGAAAAAGLAGVVMQYWGYSGLTLISLVFVLPIAVWCLALLRRHTIPEKAL